MSARTVVVGAGGYTGQELVRLACAHPELKVVGVFGSGRGEGEPALGAVAPALRGVCDLPVRGASVDSIAAERPKVVLLATPHEASVGLAAGLLEALPGVLIADLSAAFRFRDAGVYDAWYGFAHAQPGLLERAVYGLPEINRGALAAMGSGGLIACAGCYVTSAVVALRPLVRAGAVRAGTRPIIDATSGVSGAGRRAQAHTSFCEVSQSPYGVLKHRHRPEIEDRAGTAVVFQPHLGPWIRGILSTIHVELAEGWDAARVHACFEGAYGAEPFVRLLPAGHWPGVAAVERTNFVDLAFAAESHAGGGHLVLFSALDNLMKGAASQAIQCVNAAMGWDEAAGLGLNGRPGANGGGA